MNPAFIDELGWGIAEVYGAVTDQILINIAKRFPYYNADNFPRSSLTYQADMLAQMGQVNAETMRIIRDNLQDASPALSRSLAQVIIQSVRAVNPKLAYAVSNGIFKPPTVPVVAPNQMRAYTLYYKQAAQSLNLVNTVMLESTRQAYQATVSDIAARMNSIQSALNIGAGETVTGVSAWNQAVKHAIDRMKQTGITGFIDHAGHRWNAESYVAMDIRTTLFNTGRAAVWETNESFGNDLYQVSYHNGARPLCYPWQTKVISSTDNARIVKDLDGNDVTVYNQSETSYGEPAGLFGINCKHYPTPFIPGVSVTRGEPQNEEENNRAYAESQHQRALERKIREEKRDLLMLKAQNAPDELIRAQRARVRQTDDEIDKFCEETGRARRQNREGVYTKRSFPAADTYDVATFEREQKALIDGFFTSNGVQSKFNNTPGMVPKQEITQTKIVTKKPQVVEKDENWYDSEIKRLREQRSALLNSSYYDREETERLRKQIFNLEDERNEYVAIKKFSPSAIDPKELNPEKAFAHDDKWYDEEVDKLIQKRRETLPDDVATRKEITAQINKLRDEQWAREIQTSEYKILHEKGGFAPITEKHSIYQDMKATNHDFAMDKAHKVNCQRCAYAYEARRRGWDVEAGVKLGQNDEVFYYAYRFPESFSHGVTDSSALEQIGLRRNDATLKEIKRRMTEYGDGSRGFVFCQWKNGGGHYFNVENMGGEIVFIDAQSGKFGNEVEEYFQHMKPSDTALMRSDNKEFTDVLLKQKVFEKGR